MPNVAITACPATERAFAMVRATSSGSDVAAMPVALRGIDLTSPNAPGYAWGSGTDEPSDTREAPFRRSLPINSTGSLKVKAHPPGATDMAQCVESIQLRGPAASRGGGALIAVAHNIGGPSAPSEVTILEGPGTDGG